MKDQLKALTPLVQCNGIGDDGVRALVEALRQNVSLEVLSRRVCLVQLMNERMKILTPLVKSNDIGAEGAHALAEVLKHNESLATLNLAVRLL